VDKFRLPYWASSHAAASKTNLHHERTHSFESNEAGAEQPWRHRRLCRYRAGSRSAIPTRLAPTGWRLPGGRGICILTAQSPIRIEAISMSQPPTVVFRADGWAKSASRDFGDDALLRSATTRSCLPLVTTGGS
jgi:hypothetical protein